MVDKYVKRCSTSPIIKEIQIKTTMRYHFIPVRMAIIISLGKNMGKLEPLYCWWEFKMEQSLPKKKEVWRYPLPPNKNKTTIETRNSTCG